MDVEVIRKKCGIPGILFSKIEIFPDEARGPIEVALRMSSFTAMGGPADFRIVQSLEVTNEYGALRGIHIGLGRKFIRLRKGRAYCAFVDTREGAGFGKKFEIEIDNTIAIFLPEGIGNSYQVLEEGSEYFYLCDQEYSPTAPGINPGDPELAINWPIPLAEAILSEKDLKLPGLEAYR